jgi:hypothetical protein
MAVSYADYTFYTDTYLGTAIAAADFPRLALRASAVISQLCYGREAAIITEDIDTTAIEKIKLATCAVAEQIAALDRNEGGGEIASERVGNHSVQYVQASGANLSENTKLAREARLYLWETGLMYRGFADGELGTDSED